MSKERPIIMSEQSVRAILEGGKTQTRRAIKPKMFIEMNEGNDPPKENSRPVKEDIKILKTIQ